MTTTVEAPAGPAKLSHPCGYCRDNYDNQHVNCPGAVDGGKHLYVCPCGCAELRCTRCKSTEGVNPERWRCNDKDECDAAVQKRLESNPTYIMIREITAKAEERLASERAARPVRAAVADVPRPAGGKCECGCGADTKSRFAMGHDARLRGQLQRVFAAGDADAGRELVARGGVWATKAPGVAAPADPEVFVAARVAARLEDHAGWMAQVALAEAKVGKR